MLTCVHPRGHPQGKRSLAHFTLEIVWCVGIIFISILQEGNRDSKRLKNPGDLTESLSQETEFQILGDCKVLCFSPG